MKNKGMQLGAVLVAMLLVSLALVPAVSAVSATPTKTAGYEKGLINYGKS